MASPWFRLQANYYLDRDLRKAGPDARLVWPIILCVFKANGGEAVASDLDPEALADIVGGSPDLWAAGIGRLQEVGLIVEGERGGWTARSWTKFQPDSRKNSRARPAASQDVPGTERESQGVPGTQRDTVARTVTVTETENKKTEASPLGRGPAKAVPVQAQASLFGGRPELVDLLTLWPGKLGKADDLAAWFDACSSACPGVDLMAEARKARAWEASNPSKAKTAVRRFLSAWWSRAQDAPRPNAPRQQGAWGQPGNTMSDWTVGDGAYRGALRQWREDVERGDRAPGVASFLAHVRRYSSTFPAPPQEVQDWIEKTYPDDWTREVRR